MINTIVNKSDNKLLNIILGFCDYGQDKLGLVQNCSANVCDIEHLLIVRTWTGSERQECLFLYFCFFRAGKDGYQRGSLNHFHAFGIAVTNQAYKDGSELLTYNSILQKLGHTEVNLILTSHVDVYFFASGVDGTINIINLTLRKHAYSNIWKISPPKAEKNSDKKTLIFFHISAQNIDCGYSLEPPRRVPRRGGSNEYPQSMFLSRNKKNNVYPCKPQFLPNKKGV